jgi:DNA invertase Pin-like site-specific DNA recombinase
MEKVVIYLRKSRADAEAELMGEGETLARHERLLLEVAKKQRINVVDIYKEVVSGETIASRPVMQKLLTEVEHCMWSGVLVIEIDRLARGDTVDQGIMAQAFKYSNTKIITPNKIYDPANEFDEEFFEFGLFMSRREYKTINRRLQAGRIASVKEGKYVGNIPPYGYIRQKLEKEKGFTLLPHPEQAEIVRLIFDLYTGKNEKQIGVSLIVRKLNNLKIPAVNGVWVPATIQGILRNPVYIGKIRWNCRPQIKKVIDGKIKKERPRKKPDECIIANGKHEAIIEIETFELAQQLMSKNKAPCPTGTSVKNPLAGIVKCAKCGRNMVRRPYSNRGQEDTLMCPVTSCDNVSSVLRIVEEKILKYLKKWNNGLMVKIKKQTKTNINISILEKSRDKIEFEIESSKKQLDKTYDLLEKEIYDTDTFLSRSKIIAEKIKELKKDYNKINNEIKKNKNEIQARTQIIPMVSHVVDIYYKLDDPAEKNELLKKVLDKVEYIKTEKGNYNKKEIPTFEITLYPKFPSV